MDCVISRILPRSSTRSRILKSYAVRWGMDDHRPWQNVYDIAVPDDDLELYVTFCADVITEFGHIVQGDLEWDLLNGHCGHDRLTGSRRGSAPRRSTFYRHLQGAKQNG